MRVTDIKTAAKIWIASEALQHTENNVNYRLASLALALAAILPIHAAVIDHGAFTISAGALT